MAFCSNSKNNESKLVLDLTNDTQFPYFSSGDGRRWIIGYLPQKTILFIFLTQVKDSNGLFSLVVDEFSMGFSKG